MSRTDTGRASSWRRGRFASRYEPRSDGVQRRSGIVCIGRDRWDDGWGPIQQICSRLAQRGDVVLYVDPTQAAAPPGPLEALRSLASARWSPGFRTPEPNLHVYTDTLVAFLGRRLDVKLRAARLAAAAWGAGAGGGATLALHADTLSLIEATTPSVVAYLAPPEDPASIGRDVERRRRLRIAERLLVRRADAVITGSPRRHERFAAVHPNAHLLPNGADLDRFSPQSIESAEPHRSLRPHPGPCAVHVGPIDDRLDLTLLMEAARRRRGWLFVLAGEISPRLDLAPLAAEPNVSLLGDQPLAALPGILKRADACILPYRPARSMRDWEPPRLWDYLATGRPVVTTRLDSLSPLEGLIRVADTTDGFVAALDAAAREPDTRRDERLAFARANSWAARVDALERILAQASASAGRAGHGLARGTARSNGARAAREPAGLSPGLRTAFRATRVLGRVHRAARVAADLLSGGAPDVRRILVARGGRIGDLVAVLPALHALRTRYPTARIDLGVQAGFRPEPLLEKGIVNGVVVMDGLDGSAPLHRALRVARLLLAGYDLVITGASDSLLREAFFTGAPRIIALEDGHPLQTLADVRVRRLPGAHEVDDNLALAEAVGAEVPASCLAPRVAPPFGASARARSLLSELGVPHGAPVVVVHAGARKPSRRWPAERFTKLIARFLRVERGLHVVLIGGADEVELARRIIAALPVRARRRAHSAAGATDLATLMALLDVAAAAVCNDTGTMHLARALDVPLLALLGPEDDRRWGPYPAGVAPAISIRHEVPCAPCGLWECGPHYCMRSLGVDEALAALLAVLGRSHRERTVTGPLPVIDRRVVHGWADLRDRGLALPRVSVLLLAGFANGDCAATVRSLDRSLDSIRAQSYPRLDVVVGMPLGRESPLPGGWCRGRRYRVVHVPAGAGPAAWRALVASARGPLVAPAAAGWVWSDDAIGRGVASLQRARHAVAADATGVYEKIDVLAALPTGGFMLRRAAARAALKRSGVASGSAAGEDEANERAQVDRGPVARDRPAVFG